MAEEKEIRHYHAESITAFAAKAAADRGIPGIEVEEVAIDGLKDPIAKVSTDFRGQLLLEAVRRHPRLMRKINSVNQAGGEVAQTSVRTAEFGDRTRALPHIIVDLTKLSREQRGTLVGQIAEVVVSSRSHPAGKAKDKVRQEPRAVSQAS